MSTPAQCLFQQQMLDAHNAYRTNHGVPNLELDDELNLSAQAYAEKLAGMNKLVHSGTKDLGENLYEVCSQEALKSVDGAEATKTWYDENKNYDYSNPGFSQSTGHFTQVVWKGSQKLGVGCAFTKNGLNGFVVAQFSPPGNVTDAFEENVLEPNC